MTRADTQADVERFCAEAAQVLADRRCEDVRLLDVRGLSQVCDYTLIASGTSDRQMKSVAAEVEDLAKERGVGIFRRADDTGRTWVVLDLIDLVIHLFEPNLRHYYDIESLWSDAKLIDWRRDDQKDTQRFEGPIGIPADDTD